MISKIYIPSINVFVPYQDESSYTEFVCRFYGSCIKDHLPDGITFKSIEHKKDPFIQSFIRNVFVGDNFEGIKLMESKGGIVETGYFIVELEAEESLTHKKLDFVEFIFKALHENYSFIGSMFLYLLGDSIEVFSRLYTFETDAEDDETTIDEKYYQLLNSYFYDDEIPDEYLDEVAKLVLLESI